MNKIDILGTLYLIDYGLINQGFDGLSRLYDKKIELKNVDDLLIG